MPEIPPLRQRYILDISRYQENIRRARRQARDLSDTMTRGGRRMRRAVDNVSAGWGRLGMVLNRVKGAILAATTALAVRFSFRSLVNVNADLESMSVAFETMTGSAENAKKLLEELFIFTETTPFKFEQVAEAGRILIAFGGTADDVQGDLRRLGDLAAATGAPLKDLALAFGKARTMGRLMGEQINQFMERGVPLVTKLAEMFGVTNAEIRKMAEKGQIEFRHLSAVIRELTEEGGKFAGGMERQSKTLQGLFSTLSDIFDAVLREVGKGVFEEFKADIVALKDRIDELRESGELSAWSQRIGAQVRLVYTEFRSFLRILREWGPTIGRVIVSLVAFRGALIALRVVLAAYRGLLIGLGAALSVFRLGSIAAAGGLAAITGNATRAAAAMRVLRTVFMRTPWGFLIGAVAALAANFLIFRDSADDAAEGQKRWNRTLKDSIDRIKELNGAMLVQSLQGGQNRKRDLEAQIQALREENALWASSRVMVTPPEGGLGSFEKLEQEREARKAQQTNANIQRQIDENNKSILTKQKEIAAIEELREETLKRISGNLELQKEAFEELIQQINVKNDRTEEDLENLAKYEAALKRVNEEIARRGAGDDMETDLSGGITADALARARELAQRTNELLARTEELKGKETDIVELLRERHKIEDDIAKLKKAQAAVAGTKEAADLQEVINAREDEKQAIQDQIDLIGQLRVQLEAIAAEGTEVAMRIGFDLDAVDGEALKKAVNLEVDELINDLEARTEFITAQVANLDTEDPEYLANKQALEEDLAAFQEGVGERIRRLLGVLLSRGVGFATEVVGKINDLLAQIEVDDETARKFSDDVERVMTSFDEELLRLTVQLAIDGDQSAFEEGVKALADKAKADLKAAFEALSPEDQEKLRAAFEAAYSAIDAAIGRARDSVDQLQTALRSLSSFLGDIQNAARALGLDDAFADALDGLISVVNNVDKLRASLKSLESAKGFLGTLSGVLGLAGAGVGIAVGIGGLVGSLFGGKSDAERQAEIQRYQENQRRLIEVRDKIKENTHRITEKIDDLISSQVAPGVTGTEAAAAGSARDKLFETLDEIDVWLEEQIAAGNQFAGLFAQQAREEAFRQFFDDLEASGAVSREFVQEMRDQWELFREENGGVFADIPRFMDWLTETGFFDTIDEITENLGGFGDGIEGLIARIRFMQDFLGVEGANLANALIAGLRDILDPEIDKALLEQLDALEAAIAAGDTAEIGRILNMILSSFTEEGQSPFLGTLSPEDIMNIGRIIAGAFGTDVPGLGAPSGADAFAESLQRALEAVNIWTRYLEGDAQGALERFVTTLLGGEEMGNAFMRRLLHHARTADLSTPEGKARLKIVMDSIAESLDILTDEQLFARYGLTREQLTAILAGLGNIAELAGEEDPRSTSRSVQYIRQITEFQGNELLLLNSERNDILRDVRGALFTLVDLNKLRLSSSYDAVSGPTSADLTAAGGITLDVDVWAQATVESVMKEMDRAIRTELKRGFNKPRTVK